MTEKKTGTKARLMAEVKKTVFVFVYLAVFLGAFSTYRRLLLAQYQISYFHYGYTVIEALVLAKVIVFGSVLRVGERFSDRPLIVPTLYKTLCFALLVLAFSVLEHLIEGWFRGKATGVIVNEVLDQGKWEILTRVAGRVLLPKARLLGEDLEEARGVGFVAGITRPPFID